MLKLHIRKLKYLPTALLIIVAVSQLYLVKIYDLSPWYGGGFGMFSTQDVGNNRRFVVYTNSDGIKREISIPDHLAKITNKASSFPVKKRLKKLGRTLLEEKNINPEEIDSMDYQLYKLDFNKQTLEIEYSLFKSYKVEF